VVKAAKAEAKKAKAAVKAAKKAVKAASKVIKAAKKELKKAKSIGVPAGHEIVHLSGMKAREANVWGMHGTEDLGETITTGGDVVSYGQGQ
jgi:hypothetical protein